jgi:hypothetical protein
MVGTLSLVSLVRSQVGGYTVSGSRTRLVKPVATLLAFACSS